MGVEIVTKEDLEAFLGKVQAELAKVIQGQQQMLDRMDQLKKGVPASVPVNAGYILALEYMKAVGIKRWKFDQLIAGNKIRAIKKKRKIYVPVGEVERYFKDPNIR